MIGFDCPGCGAGFKVPDERAGTKGRCPKCKAVISVPQKKEPDVDSLNPMPQSHNNELRILYDYLVNDSRLPLSRHLFSESEKITLELITGPDTKRRQSVSVFIFNDQLLGDCYCAVSQVGNMPEQRTANIILSASYIMTGVRVCLSPDSIILVMAERRILKCDLEEFALLIENTARCADRLESAIFNWDAF